MSTAMDYQNLTDRIAQQFPGIILDKSEPYGMLTIEISRELILPLLRFLKEDADIQMNFLTDLCGVHYPDQAGRELGVVYHLHSFTHNIRLRIKTFFAINDPVIDSVVSLYAAANWMERETYDFFGVEFKGHPNLKRILNVDEMDYFPLRKEYPLEDAGRTDKDDRFFGRDGHEGVAFTKRVDRQ